MKRVALLAWGMIGLLGAVDVDPPEVPNPYNVSEARALRDYLTETYHQSVSDRDGVEKLRRCYRTLWNQQQLDLMLDGQAADERFVQAYLAEKRAVLVEQVLALGGTVTDQDSADDLKRRIAQLKKEAEEQAAAKRQRDNDAARAAAIAQLEADAAARQATAKPGGNIGDGSDGVNRITLVSVASEKDLQRNEALIAAMLADQCDDRTTQVERAAYVRAAEAFVQTRQNLKEQGYVPQFSAANGVEVWTRIVPDRRDPEKMTIALIVVNPTAYRVHVQAVDFSMSGSRRNPPSVREKWGRRIPVPTAFPRDFLDSSSKVYYSDPGQVVTVTDVMLVQGEKGGADSRASGVEDAERESDPR